MYSFDRVAVDGSCDRLRHDAHAPGQFNAGCRSVLVVVDGVELQGLCQRRHRTLRFGGFLKIAEPISRWQDKRSELLTAIADAGFLLVGGVEESNQFLYIDAIKTDR